jgi:hypothetical protein
MLLCVCSYMYVIGLGYREKWPIMIHNSNCQTVLYVDVQDVQPNSPAAQAGLLSDTDYIIGADTVLHEVCFGLSRQFFLWGLF